jgi:hypothetical protein
MVLATTLRQQASSVRVRLGPLLGHVTPELARVFIRLHEGAPGAITARSRALARDEQARSTELPPGPGGAGIFVGDVPLAGGPGVLHEITLKAGGSDLGSIMVRAAEPSSASGRIAFAFGSCWRVDSGGRPEATWTMLEALARARVVDHLLLLGDQLYADVTPLPSRPGETATSLARALGPAVPLAERIEPFREAYQRAWDVPALQHVLSMMPVASLWDDHEIVNGFGSLPEHHGPEWRPVFEAAAAAFDEFQGSRNPPRIEPGARGWAFRRGPAAFVGLDLRTHRNRAEGMLIGAEQKRAVQGWIEDEAQAARVLFVACSVPPLHLPSLMPALHGIADLRDQWDLTSEDDRRWLLQRVLDFEEGGRRRVVILGGDAHLATAVTLRSRSGRALWQLTSSPLAQRFPPVAHAALTLLGRRFDVSSERGETHHARIERRWRGPNVGVVQGLVEDDRIELAFELQRPGRRSVAMELRARLA